MFLSSLDVVLQSAYSQKGFKKFLQKFYTNFVGFFLAFFEKIFETVRLQNVLWLLIFFKNGNLITKNGAKLFLQSFVNIHPD